MHTVNNLPLLRHWITHTVLGWITGIFIIIGLSGILEQLGYHQLQFYLGVGMGAGIGFFQWLALRRQFNISIRYAFHSLVGMGVPFMILDLFSGLSHEWNLLLGIPLCALLSSFLQSLSFSSLRIKRSHWIVYSVLAWLLTMGLLQLTTLTMHLRSQGANVLILAVVNLLLILAGGLILGYLTGRVLGKSQQNPTP